MLKMAFLRTFCIEIVILCNGIFVYYIPSMFAMNGKWRITIKLEIKLQ